MREISLKEAQTVDKSGIWIDSDMVSISIGTLRELFFSFGYTQKDLEDSWQEGYDEGYEDRAQEEE